MKYKTIDELNHFHFDQAMVVELKQMNGYFQAILDVVVILPENTTNRDIFEMGANNLHLTIEEGQITSFVKEGYNRYDANDVLLEKIPDETVDPADYHTVLKELSEKDILSIEKDDDTYVFSIDTTYHVYCIRVSGTHDIEEWDRYMSLKE